MSDTTLDRNRLKSDAEYEAELAQILAEIHHAEERMERMHQQSVHVLKRVRLVEGRIDATLTRIKQQRVQRSETA
jgi:hypothetical protein